MLSGEGVGIVVLKRLRDAEREGDRIYAVLKGVGLSSDGRGRGLTSPSSKGHARAIRRAYRRAGIDPATVGLVEGAWAGRARRRPRGAASAGARLPDAAGPSASLGAVSAQIGHAMPAAGMAGLIKRGPGAPSSGSAAPTSNAESPDPRVAASGFELIAQARPWIHGDPRLPAAPA